MGRKITANMYMTPDGFGDFPEYPGSDVVSDTPDEAFNEMRVGSTVKWIL